MMGHGRLSYSICEVFGREEIYDGPFLSAEIEIENVSSALLRCLDTERWAIHSEGSLRNNGQEFVTAFPLPKEHLIKDIADLFTLLSNHKASFSPRCSIHIHQNFQSSTVEELLKTLYLYLVLEDSLFRIAGKERKKSNFCVPLKETNLTNKLDWRDPEIQIQKRFSWKKYTALNLTRLQDIGTIEYRHLVGTYDMDVITKWIYIIDRIKSTHQDIPIEDFYGLLTSYNEIESLHKQLLGSCHSLLWDPQYSEEEVSSGLLFLQFGVFKSPFTFEVKNNNNPLT